MCQKKLSDFFRYVFTGTHRWVGSCDFSPHMLTFGVVLFNNLENYEEIERFVGKMGHQKNGITFHFRSMSIETRGVVLTHVTWHAFELHFLPNLKPARILHVHGNNFWALALHSMERRTVGVLTLMDSNHTMCIGTSTAANRRTHAPAQSVTAAASTGTKVMRQNPQERSAYADPAQRRSLEMPELQILVFFFSELCCLQNTRESQPIVWNRHGRRIDQIQNGEKKSDVSLSVCHGVWIPRGSRNNFLLQGGIAAATPWQTNGEGPNAFVHHQCWRWPFHGNVMRIDFRHPGTASCIKSVLEPGPPSQPKTLWTHCTHRRLQGMARVQERVCGPAWGFQGDPRMAHIQGHLGDAHPRTLGWVGGEVG